MENVPEHLAGRVSLLNYFRLNCIIYARICTNWLNLELDASTVLKWDSARFQASPATTKLDIFTAGNGVNEHRFKHLLNYCSHWPLLGHVLGQGDVIE